MKRLTLPVLCLLLSAPHSAQAQAMKTGALCTWGIVVGLDHYQSHCAPLAAPEQAFLTKMAARHTDFVKTNGWTEAKIAQFESRMASDGQSPECNRSDLDQMLAAILSDKQVFREAMDEVLSTETSLRRGVCL